MIFTILYATVFLLTVIIAFTIMVIIYALTAWADPKQRLFHPVCRFFALLFIKMSPGWKFHIQGLEKIDRKRKYVVIVNHQSMLDIPLMYHLPLNFKWVAKHEVYKIPFFGIVMYLHKDIAIKRGESGSLNVLLNNGLDRLANDSSVFIFPEGTRSKSGRINRFKDGAFILAQRAGVDILPVVIEGTKDLVDGKRLRCRHDFYIRVLDPIPAEQVQATEEKELAKQMNTLMVEEHKQLRPDLYN